MEWGLFKVLNGVQTCIPGLKPGRGGELSGRQSCCPSTPCPADLRKSEGAAQEPSKDTAHRAKKWVLVGTPNGGRFFLECQESLVGGNLCAESKRGLRGYQDTDYFDFHHGSYASPENHKSSAAQKLTPGL